MNYDLNMFIRNQLRQAAAVHIQQQAAMVADEITGHSEDTYETTEVCETCGDFHDDDYIPEVETGGARDFGDKPIISPEQQADEEVWLGILNDFWEGIAALRRPQDQDPQANQDHGDTRPADVAPACTCQRRHANGCVCTGSLATCGHHRL